MRKLLFSLALLSGMAFSANVQAQSVDPFAPSNHQGTSQRVDPFAAPSNSTKTKVDPFGQPQTTIINERITNESPRFWQRKNQRMIRKSPEIIESFPLTETLPPSEITVTPIQVHTTLPHVSKRVNFDDQYQKLPSGSETAPLPGTVINQLPNGPFTQESVPPPVVEEGQVLNQPSQLPVETLHGTGAGIPVMQYPSDCTDCGNSCGTCHSRSGRFWEWLTYRPSRCSACGPCRVNPHHQFRNYELFLNRSCCPTGCAQGHGPVVHGAGCNCAN